MAQTIRAELAETTQGLHKSPDVWHGSQGGDVSKGKDCEGAEWPRPGRRGTCSLPFSGACSHGTEHPGLSRHQGWGNRCLEGYPFHTFLLLSAQAGREHGMSRDPVLQAHLDGSLSPSLQGSS